MKPLIIYGPTSTGKTALAIKIAKDYKCEIISADSRQVYKNLDIGTGKISFEEEYKKEDGYWIVSGVRINGFDIVETQKSFTASDFLSYAKTTIDQIKSRGKDVIITGGTAFYIYSFINGIDSRGIPPNLKLRKSLEKLSVSELFENLLRVNPIRANSMNDSDRKNPRRLIRAIEIAKSKQHTNYEKTTNEYFLIGLTAPNDFLYEKADKWLLKRFDLGLVKEVEKLLLNGVKPQWLINLGLEYKWVTKYAKDEIDYQNMIKNLQGDIHDFIRRQKTWFNKFPDIHKIEISKKNSQVILEKKLNLWYTHPHDKRKTY